MDGHYEKSTSRTTVSRSAASKDTTTSAMARSTSSIHRDTPSAISAPWRERPQTQIPSSSWAETSATTAAKSGLQSIYASHKKYPSLLPPPVLPCPGSTFEDLQIRRQRKPDEPFFELAMGLNIPLTIDTIKRAQDADAESNVWFGYAHDPSMYGVVDFFPGSANDWMEKGWRERTLWAFLRDFEGATQKQ